LSVFKTLEIKLEELDDWNCCGATAYMAVDELKAYALASRNLAIAEKYIADGQDTIDIIAPCAACYLVLYKAQKFLEGKNGKSSAIHCALKEAGLQYTGKARVRHPLDVLINDVGVEKIRSCVTRPLKGLKVASYYGCQILRPYGAFDNPDAPQSMDRLVEALGAEPVEWALKTRCCGASLTGTVEEVGLRLSYILLKEAARKGADVVSTACPLCQFNLECYQDRMRAQFDDQIQEAVVYFSQLMGMAFGLSDKDLGLQRSFVPFAPALAVK